MTDIMTRVRAAMARRRRYHETVNELRRLPIDVALDLEIDRDQAPRIAHQAVYGA